MKKPFTLLTLIVSLSTFSEARIKISEESADFILSAMGLFVGFIIIAVVAFGIYDSRKQRDKKRKRQERIARRKKLGIPNPNIKK